MSSCAGCRAQAVPPLEPSLFQIREEYQTEWNHLTLSVRSDSGEWTLQVQDTQRSEILYKAQRIGVRAAQVAAAEFAIFRVLGVDSRVSPAQLANDLMWQRY